jgi:uncharacterized protein YaaR (DUF327 family)
MSTKNNTCSTKYAYLELVFEKDNSYEVAAGLFKGLLDIKGSKYILLQGTKDTVDVMNTNFYDIMTIEQAEEKIKSMVYLTNDKDDQKTAMQMLENIYKELIDGGKALENDPNIIDISKYSGVPKEYSIGSNNSSVIGSTSIVNRSNMSTIPTVPKKNEGPKVAFIERDEGSKKPTTKELDTLSSMLDAIKTGKLKIDVPQLKGDESDEDDGDNNNSNVNGDDDDNYEDYFNGYRRGDWY